MTNEEWLKSLDTEEFAKLIQDVSFCSCGNCPYKSDTLCEKDCIEGRIEWLKAEREEKADD